MNTKIQNYICSIIPKCNNKTVIGFYELLRKLHRKNTIQIDNRLGQNRICFEKYWTRIKTDDGYIECQNDLTDLRFGKVNIRFSGCEIIAVYNVLRDLSNDRKVDFAQLIADFEKDGCVLSGKFGTAPKAMKDYFKKNGFKVIECINNKDYDEVAKQSDSLILTMYNDAKDIRKEIHTINISKNGGNYLAHNVYCNGTVVGPFGTISELIENINSGKAKGIYLLGIKRR